MFRICTGFSTAAYATALEALDEALKRSGVNIGAEYIVIEEIASVQSARPVPPIETKITPLKQGFRV